jgi:membrane protein implicated in regulation of membrane protease activity
MVMYWFLIRSKGQTCYNRTMFRAELESISTAAAAFLLLNPMSAWLLIMVFLLWVTASILLVKREVESLTENDKTLLRYLKGGEAR